MTLVFYKSPEQPVECALEITRALKAHPELEVRIGVHSGPISAVTDLNDRTNVAGVGMNIAPRVMDCGDAGHILLSKRVAEDLAQYGHWQSQLHDLGEVEVKHGVRIHVFNLYTEDLGNPELPEKLREAKPKGQEASDASARPLQPFDWLDPLLRPTLIAPTTFTQSSVRRQPHTQSRSLRRDDRPTQQIFAVRFERAKANAALLR